MPKVNDFKDEKGVNIAELEKAAIRINRKAQVDDIYAIYDQIKGNELGIKHVGSFLKYANELLTDAETGLSYRDYAAAEVSYCGVDFIFMRM